MCFGLEGSSCGYVSGHGYTLLPSRPFFIVERFKLKSLIFISYIKLSQISYTQLYCGFCLVMCI